MIKANQLRIGNWVETELDGFVQIIAIHKSGSLRYNDTMPLVIDHIKPINLTPEILEKCSGVERNGYTYYLGLTGNGEFKPYNLTPGEERQLLEYLAFLRSRKKPLSNI